MSSVYKILTSPTAEPITLSDAKAYLRVDFPDDDATLAGIITRARAFAETKTGRAYATQTIQHLFTIEAPKGGQLSGPLTPGPNWYQYNEQLGANPFGAAQFYFDLARPPIQASQPILVETKVIAFDPWVTFSQVASDGVTPTTYVDDTSEPARMYFQDPITANFWRFTYTAGYSASYPLPPDLLQPLMELIAYWYDHREADDLPKELLAKFLAKRVDWIV